MTLYIRQRFFSFGDSYRICDEYENPVFEVQGRVFTIGAKLYLYNLQGQELYYIERQLFRFLPQYYIYEQGRQCAVVNKEFSLFTPSLNIDCSYGNITINGDFFSMCFDIYLNGGLIGSISKQFFAFTDCYRLEIPDNSNAAFFCALVIAIDNCLHNEEHH